MSSVFDSSDVTFDSSQCLYNILTKKVLPERETNQFLDAENIDQQRHKQFAIAKLEGVGSMTLLKEKNLVYLHQITRRKK